MYGMTVHNPCAGRNGVGGWGSTTYNSSGGTRSSGSASTGAGSASAGAGFTGSRYSGNASQPSYSRNTPSGRGMTTVRPTTQNIQQRPTSNGDSVHMRMFGPTTSVGYARANVPVRN